MIRKCAICGLESKIEGALLPDSDTYSSEAIFYCPECSNKRSTQLGQSFLIATFIALTGGFIWVIVYPQNEFAWLCFEGGMLMCFIFLLTLPHELGHVLAAYLTKASIYQVTIGLGRIFYRRDFLGIQWQFCIIPICGYVYTWVNNKSFYRMRNFLIYSGGCLMNLIMAITAVILLYNISSIWLSAVIKSFIAANIFEVAHNLYPRKINFAGIVMSSDGLSLLKILFMSDSKINQEIESISMWQKQNLNIKGRNEEAQKRL
jgi:drug/metabolite transporter superfamily protein YnfA